MFSILVIIMVSDYHHMIIPDTMLIVLAFIIIVFKLLIGFYSEEITSIMDAGYMIIFMLLEGLIMFIIMFILQKIGNLIFKSNSLGLEMLN